VGRENIYKCKIGKEGLYQEINDKGVRTVNFATSKKKSGCKEHDVPTQKHS
jgi:hypothetical protein